jgi:PAS domain S-box-containing protein
MRLARSTIYLVVFLFLGVLWFVNVQNSSASEPKRRILILYSFGYGLPAYEKINPAFLSAIKNAGISTDELFFEYLDLLRNQDKDHRRYLLDLFRHKYVGHKIDLIVTVHGPALHFLLNEGKEIFPNAPVLSLLAPETIELGGTGRRIVLLPISLDMRGTLERALELFPETARVVFVGGFSEVDRRFEREARSAFAPWQDKLEFEYTSDLTIDEMLQRVANLPPRTIVIYSNVFNDKTGRMVVPRDVGEMVAKSANAPVFGLYDTLLGTGIIGGSLLSFEAEGARMGKLALDMLSGKLDLAEPVTTLAITKIPMFDWQQVEKWNGNASRLPEQSVFVNRVPSIWDQFRLHIVIVVVFSLAQSALIVALLAHRRHRRSAEETLEKQLRFETLLAELSARLVRLSPSEVDREIEQALGLVMDFFRADRCGLIKVYPDRKSARVTHAHYAEGIEQVSPDIELAVLFPWYYHVLVEQGQHNSISRLSELPEEAEKDRQSLAAMGTRSVLAIPLFIEEGIGHLIVIHTVREERVWPKEHFPQMRLLGEIFVNALARRDAEQALRESEMRLSLAADSAGAGLWSMDIDTGLIWGTEKAVELYGFAPDEEVNLDKVRSIVHFEDRDRFDHSVLDVVRNRDRANSIEYRIVLPGGSIRYISSRSRGHTNSSGRLARLMGVSIDITEQKRTEETLRESEEFNRTILASLRTRIAILDKKGTIVSVSEAWEQFAWENGAVSLAGLGPGINYLEACQRSILANDDLATQAREGIQSVLDGKMDLFSLEYPCHSPSESRWFLMEVMPFRRSEGGVVVSHTDVTKRKNAELEARQRGEELAHVTRIATIGELGTSLAHEINQPLTAILCNAEAAQRFLSGVTPDLDEVRQILDDIVKDDKRAGEVIRRMRTLVKKQAPRRNTVDLNDTIRETLALARSTSFLEGLTMVAELDPELPTVQGDRVQLQQVILNLLLNAIAAMKDIPTASRELIVKTTRDENGTAMVAVTDSGTGFDRNAIDRLFEPFYTTKGEGLGMGLSISQTIIKAHGGAIGAANNPKGGATFTVTLPFK